MALKKQTISFPILKGSDEKTSLPASQPGSVKDATEVSFNKTGEVVKRKGFDNFRNISGTVGDQSSPFGGLVPSATNTKKGVRLHKFKDSLLMADGQMLYSKVGASDMKPIEFLLDCTYANNSVFTPSNKKVGRVNVIRKTLNSVDYDIISYVQVKPSQAVSGDTIQIMMAVREVESGAFYRAPTEIVSFSRSGASGTNAFYQEVACLPSLHMFEASNNKIYLVYSNVNSTGAIPTIQAREFNFSGTTPPVLTGTSAATLRTSGSANIQIHHNVPGIGATISTDQTSLYIAYYQENFASFNTNEIVVAKFSFSGFASNWDASIEKDVTAANLDFSGAVTSTALNTQSIGYGAGNFLGIALSYSDPEDSLSSSQFPLMVAFTRKLSGGAKASETEVVYRFINAGLTASGTAGPIGHNNLAYRYLINGTQSLIAADTSDIFLTVSSQTAFTGTVSNPTMLNSGGGSAFFEYNTVKYGGVKSVTVSGIANGQEKEGLVRVLPDSTLTGAVSASELASECVLYVQQSAAGAAVNVSVIEPGSGFIAGDSATIDSAIVAFIAGSLAITVTIELDEDNESIRTKNHEVLYIDGDHDAIVAPNAPVSICKNASLISDSFRDYVSTSLKADATGVGLKTYVNISRTNGNTGSFNSFNSLIDTAGRLLACTPTGTSSLNYGSDYESIYRNKIRLFDGVSRVQRVDGISGYGKIASNFIFGSNVLIADGNTYTDSEDSQLASQVGSDQFYSVGITEVDPLPDRSLPAVDVGNQLLIGGGVLCAYDGNTLVENGFYEHPEIRTLTPIATNFASNLASSKTYTYSFVYEFIDSLNNIHESVTTPQVQVDTTSTKGAVCAKVYACDITLKRGSVRVTMYRSTPSGDGVLLKKVKTAILDASQRDFTFYDFGEVQDVFDAAPVIYTTGGVLDNNQPGSMTDVIEHRGRVFLATPTEFVRFSKPLQQGFAAGFPVPQFVIDVPGDASDITGIESNSNFLCLFTRDSVFAVSGDGPNALGQGGFSQPTLLGNGQGAVPGSAHLSHAFGTFYAADRGIYLVTPNGQIQYVGAPVEDTVGGDLVKSIDVFDHTNEIRFLIQSSSNSKICCFNTFYKQWSVWSLAESIVDQINYSATGGSGDDTHYLLSKKSPIRRQSTTNYVDNITDLGSGVTAKSIYAMTVDFMPISINAIQGTQRVYRAMILYTAKDAALVGLQILVANDYENFSSGTGYVLTTVPNAPGNIRIHVKNQKSRAIQLRVGEVTSGASDTVSGITLSGLALEIGARPGTFKLPKAQTIAPL